MHNTLNINKTNISAYLHEDQINRILEENYLTVIDAYTCIKNSLKKINNK